MTCPTKIVEISRESDVARAVTESQRFLREQGFDRTRGFLIATAVSELARNIFVYAGVGRISLRVCSKDQRVGVEVVAEDEGPGIDDFALALTEAYSTGQTLGLGLPGVKRIMDQLDLDENRESGTRLVAWKWR